MAQTTLPQSQRPCRPATSNGADSTSNEAHRLLTHSNQGTSALQDGCAIRALTNRSWPLEVFRYLWLP